MLLKDKVCIVTGGSAGIGRKIAERFNAEGAGRIIIFDMNEEEGKKTASEISDRAIFEKVNVANFAEVEARCGNIVDKFNKIDIMINNAGITRDNLLMRMSEEDWDAVVAVNLKGVFNCIKAVSRYMLKARAGKIVNMASVSGLMGTFGQANYAASKGGVISLTKTAAREFASRGINVNAIAPGFISTRMTEKLTDDVKNKYLSMIPLGRFGLTDDIANAALFLSCPLSDYITGQVLVVDGGLVM